MDLTLTPREQAVLDAARAAAPALAERAGDADRQARFPAEDLDDLRRHGLMALAVPRDDGGRGESVVSYVLACEAIAAADASVAVAWVMHTACGWEIAQSAREPMRSEWLDTIVNGRGFVCIAGAEGRRPDGSPAPLSVSRHGDGWLLEGRKGFASGADAATHVLTGGKDADGTHHSFVIPMSHPGVSIVDRWDGMGMRASASHGLSFDCAAVPDAWRLESVKREGDFRNTSALFGLGLAATALGIATAAFDFAVAWARRRELSETNRVRLGDISVRLEAVRSLLWRSAAEADRDPAACEPWVDRSKTLAVETGQAVALEAMRLCGGSAFRQRYPLERHLRDSAALLLQGQRPDMLRANVAARLLAEDVP